MRGRVLGSGEVLANGDYLESDDGRLRLIMQTDGNLVLYCYTKTVAHIGAVALAQSANGQTADQFTSEVANAYYGQGYTLCPATPG